MFPFRIPFLKRPPRVGGGKDRTMSPTSQSPGTAAPRTPQGEPAGVSSPASAPGTPPDVSRQIAELTQAVNRLVQAQQPPPPQRAPYRSPVAPPEDIGGDLPGGEPLVAAIDHARLSPLQQIALGLRSATPVGLARPAVERTRAPAALQEPADDPAPAGAD